jgi:hypothetical protein
MTRWRGNFERAQRAQRAAAAAPAGFAAIADAVLSRRREAAVDACDLAGRAFAHEGRPLGEGLDLLRATTVAAARREPRFAEVRAFGHAWSETTLAYLHGLSCADPLTGLATHAHVRDRLADLYREPAASAASDRHALVVTQALLPDDPLSSARALTLLGRTARTVFPSAQAIGQVRHDRMVVVAPRDEGLGRRVSLLRRMAGQRVDRVWIEGLPSTDSSAASLLDELARI